MSPGWALSSSTTLLSDPCPGMASLTPFFDRYYGLSLFSLGRYIYKVDLCLVPGVTFIKPLFVDNPVKG
jgi:hypothetical protein